MRDGLPKLSDTSALGMSLRTLFVTVYNILFMRTKEERVL